MKKLVIVGMMLVAAGMAEAGLRALNPVPRGKSTNDWWIARFEQEKALAKTGEYPIVFIGDSITHLWDSPKHGLAVWNANFTNAPLKAINAGIGGDRTEHVLWRLRHGQLDDMKNAKAVVFMLGTNNSGHFKVEDEKPAATALGLEVILDTIREKCPNATIIVHPIFPRGPDAKDSTRLRNETVNEALRRYVVGKPKFVWCDFNDKFLLPGGALSKTMMPDLLHPGPYGYEIWAAAVVPEIKKALGVK